MPCIQCAKRGRLMVAGVKAVKQGRPVRSLAPIARAFGKTVKQDLKPVTRFMKMR